MREQALPLTGIRILDLTRATSGPYCTQILADLGADVVKVEEPPGPRGRDLLDPFNTVGGMDAYFLCVNRNKKSVALTLGHERGPALVQQLAAVADVVVENFRPGVSDKMGIGLDLLRKQNEKLITCSLSGFGGTGPLRNRAAFDITVQSATGVMSFINRRDASGRLTPVPIPIADLLAGIHCAVAIPAALVQRSQTGVGSHIDVGMYDSLISWFVGFGVQQLNFGTTADIQEKLLWGSFDTRDRPLLITAHRAAQWRRFCTALEHLEWTEDPRFADPEDRVENIDELKHLIEEVLCSRTADEWIVAFEREGVSYSDTSTMVEALAHPQTVDREMVVEVEHPVAGVMRLLGSPIKITGTDPRLEPPPLAGEHSVEVLSEWLGYELNAIQDLIASGLVYSA